MKKFVSYCLVLLLLLQLVPTAFAAIADEPITVVIESGIRIFKGKEFPFNTAQQINYASISAVLQDLSDGKLTNSRNGVDYTIDEGYPCTIQIDTKRSPSAYEETIDGKVIFANDEGDTAAAQLTESNAIQVNFPKIEIVSDKAGGSRDYSHEITFAGGIEVGAGVEVILDNGSQFNDHSTINYIFESDVTVNGTLEFSGNVQGSEIEGPVTFTGDAQLIVEDGGDVTIGRVAVTGEMADPLIEVQSGGMLTVSAPLNNAYGGSIEAAGTAIQNDGGTLNLDSGSITTDGTDTPVIVSNGGEVNLVKTQEMNRPRKEQIPVITIAAPSGAPAIQINGGSLTVAAGTITSEGSQPAIEVTEGEVTITTEEAYEESAGVLTPTVTSGGEETVALSAGVTVTNAAGVSATVSEDNVQAGDNYVDNDGNIILAAGAKADNAPLENAAVILPDGTIIQGSKDEAPTIDKADDGTTTVTVPAGGSVQKPGGDWVNMPAGGTADSAGNVTAVPVATVTFENADVEPITVLPGETITLPTPDDTRDAIFRYWTVAGDPIGTRYYGGEEFRADEDTTFVANWKDNSYIPIPPTQPTRPTEPDEPDIPDEPDTPDVPDTPDIPDPGYVDVPAAAWYYDAVAYAADKGLMTGTESGAFAPELTTTRAMIWTILGRMSGASVSGGEPWYALAQSWAVSSGVSDGSDPDSKITREQLAAMLYRYAGQPELLDSELAGLSGYADHNDVSSYAYRAMAWAVSRGIINGIGDSLAPQGLATRAQVAAMLMRFCEMDQ